MALITDVKRICDRLADAGWQALLLKQGIDLKQVSEAALESALDINVNVDRSMSGFEDFVASRAKGIEPGNPAASLLYHAFASPNVTMVPQEDTALGPLSQAITDFPSLEELDTIANYIFAKANRSLADVRQYAAELLGINSSIDSNAVELSIAVFASEYRPAPETPHQRYADLCHSRTGAARVGTARAIYDGQLRGYVPFRDGDSSNTIRILPCHYTTWIAVRSSAQESRFGPARLRSGDETRHFWVPVHKLFNGDECLKGETLDISLSTQHQNKKLERLHQRLEDTGFPSGFSATERQQPPFINEQGIVDGLVVFQGGACLLSPQPQPLVARASFDNAPLTFQAPPMQGSFSAGFSPTLSLNAPAADVRPWPEYAHVRFEVDNGNTVYFGDRPNAVNKATEGDYRSLNISDFTGDGWIKASVPALSTLDSIPAYSLVAAPDFFPAVDQREVYEWWEEVQNSGSLPNQPSWLRRLISEGYLRNLWRVPPVPLSDERFAPNVTLTDSEFKDDDDTVTAIVTSLQSIDLLKSKPMVPTTERHAALPDAAAGIFAPGWDTSGDRRPGGNIHLASYGLGSPFPEDAKLCAALSTFWPAVAPDTERTFFGDQSSSRRGTGTVCPLTDEENGAVQGSISWDGLRGPRVIAEDGSSTVVRYPSYEYADYTLNALEGRFSIAATKEIDFREYTGRILVTLRMYRALEQIGTKRSLHILSFRKVDSGDFFLRQAQNETGRALSGPVYRFDVFNETNATRLASASLEEEDFRVNILFTLLVGTSDFLLAMARRGDGSQARSPWQTINA